MLMAFFYWTSPTSGNQFKVYSDGHASVPEPATMLLLGLGLMGLAGSGESLRSKKAEPYNEGSIVDEKTFYSYISNSAFFSIMGTANANLINNGGTSSMITDLNITWYAVSSNTTMGWVSANTWANSQTYGGVTTGWRLPRH